MVRFHLQPQWLLVMYMDFVHIYVKLLARESRLGTSSTGAIIFHGVRYLSAGLNNLKSDLDMSVNYLTSVNVDLSMSLNCSFYIPY